MTLSRDNYSPPYHLPPLEATVDAARRRPSRSLLFQMLTPVPLPSPSLPSLPPPQWFGDGAVARVAYDDASQRSELVALADGAVRAHALVAPALDAAHVAALLPPPLVARVVNALAKQVRSSFSFLCTHSPFFCLLIFLLFTHRLQAVEKIDSVRSCAGSLLQRLVVAAPRALPLPEHDALASIFPPLAAATATTAGAEEGEEAEAAEGAQRAIDWAVPLVSFPLLSQLLGLETYRGAVIAGLALSVGGLTESTVKASKACLLAWARSAQLGGKRRELDAAFGALLGELTKHARRLRVVVPVFRTLDTLLVQGARARSRARRARRPAGRSLLRARGTHASPPAPPPPPRAPGYAPSLSVGAGLLACVLSEIRQSRDVAKLVAAASVLLGLLDLDDAALRTECFRALFAMLVWCFPNVRKAVAENLYTYIVTNDEVVVDMVARDGVAEEDEGAAVEAVLECLSLTSWDSEVGGECARSAARLSALASLCAALPLPLAVPPSLPSARSLTRHAPPPARILSATDWSGAVRAARRAPHSSEARRSGAGIGRVRSSPHRERRGRRRRPARVVRRARGRDGLLKRNCTTHCNCTSAHTWSSRELLRHRASL